MNIHERTLSVLAYRCVDEVVIGAPYSVTKVGYLHRAYHLLYIVKRRKYIQGPNLPLLLK